MEKMDEMNEKTPSTKRAVFTIDFLGEMRKSLTKEIKELQDRAKQELEENGFLSLQTENEIYRRQVAQYRALKEISEGKYGICKRCQRPIEEERLRRVPEAAICCSCIREDQKNKKNAKRRY